MTEIPADIQELFARMREDPELERMAREMLMGKGTATPDAAPDKAPTGEHLSHEEEQQIDDAIAEAEEFAPEQRELMEQLKSFILKMDTFETNFTRGVMLTAEESTEMLYVMADLLATWSEACLENECLISLLYEYPEEHPGCLETVAEAKRIVEGTLAKWPTPSEVLGE